MLGLLALAGSAEAQVLVLADGPEGQELVDSLGVELAGRGVEIQRGAPPSGPTSLSRAADAQRRAVEAGADIVVFVERHSAQHHLSDASSSGVVEDVVRALQTAGEDIHEAPLPEDADPRTAAIIAASVLEQMGSIPAAAVSVNVQVDVQVQAAASPQTSHPLEQPSDKPLSSGGDAGSLSPPAPNARLDVGADEGLSILPREGYYMEAGFLFAGVAGGVELGFSRHLSQSVRLGLHLATTYVLPAEYFAYRISTTVTRVGGAASGRFDYGARLGAVGTEESQMGWTATGFFGWGWDVEGFGLTARGELGVAQLEWDEVVPVAMLSAGVELPLLPL